MGNTILTFIATKFSYAMVDKFTESNTHSILPRRLVHNIAEGDKYVFSMSQTFHEFGSKLFIC